MKTIDATTLPGEGGFRYFETPVRFMSLGGAFMRVDKTELSR